MHDHAPEQKWRHLDAMQFGTILIARIPRCNCKQHGVKTSGVPWADKHSRLFITCFKNRVSNAVSDGLNSKIQVIKASARGFHCFGSYRTRILFYCAKLNMAIS